MRAGQPPKTGINQYDRALTDNRPTAITAVHNLLERIGALDAATKYRGGDSVVVRAVTLHVSKPGDQHHSQQFKDCEETTSLLNLHLDPKPGILKAMIYLSDVGPEDGPFSYIEGSHKWGYDEMDRIFAWGNSVGNYCHTPTHRIVANAFPKRFRGNAIIGRLIPDFSKLSDELTKALVPYHSDTANCMVFDPSFGFHRGGQCESGTRVNLQVVLR